MGWYEQGFASVAAATGAAYASVQGATTRAAEVVECGFFCNAATASSVLLGRPANTPAATSPVVVNAKNPDTAVAGVTGTASAWSTAPTTPTVVFRRITLPATIGAGYVGVWAYGQGITLSKTAGTTQWLILWNFGAGTGSVLNCYVAVEE